MKQQNSEKSSDHSRGTVPLLMVEGKRVFKKSARKAGAAATRYARKGRRIVGQTVERTKAYARRSPWKSLGSALCTGLFVGALATWFFTKD